MEARLTRLSMGTPMEIFTTFLMPGGEFPSCLYVSPPSGEGVSPILHMGRLRLTNLPSILSFNYHLLS